MQQNRHIFKHQDCTFEVAGKQVFWYSESTDNQYIYVCQNYSNFTGKEKDSESGYYYFGARYLDQDMTTLFLSVDPMADKYPNISPYAYCMWNPIKLVDPDGRDVWTVSENGYIKKTSNDGGTKKQTIIFANGHVATFKGEKYYKIISDLSINNKDNVSSSYGDDNMQSAYANVFKSMADNTNVEWIMERYSDNSYALGTMHNETRSPKAYELSQGHHHDCDVIALIHSHPMVSGHVDPTSTDSQISSMGYCYKKGVITGDAFIKRKSLRNAHYYTYFPKTRQLWCLGLMTPSYIKNINIYTDFFFGAYNSK